MVDRYDDTLILGYLEGDLSDADPARFEAQMAQDAALATLVEGLSEDRAALRRLPTVDPPMGLADAAMSREERSMLLGDPDPATPKPSHNRQDVARRFHLRRTIGYLAVAAPVAICGGIMLISLSDPWLESGHQWLGDIGLAKTEETTPQAPAAGARSMAKQSERAAGELEPRSLLGAVTKERSESNQVDTAVHARAAASAPAPLKADGMSDTFIADNERVTPTEATGGKARGSALYSMHANDEAAAVGGRLPEKVRSDVAGNALPSVAPPTVVIDVDTDDADSTRREVYAWALSNAAVIEPAASVATPVTASAETYAAPKPSASANNAQRPAEQLTMVLDRRQLPNLLDQLNRRAGQRAQVAVAAAPASNENLPRQIDALMGVAPPADTSSADQRLVTEESLKDAPAATANEPVETHVARMPQRAEDDSPAPLSPVTVPPETEPLLLLRSPGHPDASSDQTGVEQPLPFVNNTPLLLFENDASARVELRINTIDSAQSQ